MEKAVALGEKKDVNISSSRLPLLHLRGSMASLIPHKDLLSSLEFHAYQAGFCPVSSEQLLLAW